MTANASATYRTSAFPRAQPQLASRLTARRWWMKRQPTACGSSPWQQVERPLGCRGVDPVWPIWFMCVMKRRTGSPSPLRSTSDLLPPSEAFAARRKPRISARPRRRAGRHRAVLGPPGAGDKQQFGVRTDRLLARLSGLRAYDGGAGRRLLDRDGLDGRRACGPAPRSGASGVERTTHGRCERVSTASMRWR